MPVRLLLRALIYRDDDCWVAHCLETDVVADGPTPAKAYASLLSLTNLQIAAALEEGDIRSIFRPAPEEIHAQFACADDRPFRRSPPTGVERFDVRTLQPA
jgi:predicted RNase H-like HicB family nuclease